MMNDSACGTKILQDVGFIEFLSFRVPCYASANIA